MAGAIGDNVQIDSAELLDRSDLSAVDQRRVHNASVNGMIDGWTPTRQSVLRLIDFAAGRIDAETLCLGGEFALLAGSSPDGPLTSP